MNERENFENEVENMKSNNMENGLTEVLTMGVREDIIYNALRATYEIALKAPKFKNNDGVMSASFQYVDMEHAVLPVQIFMGELIKNGLSKDNTLKKSFEVIKDNYEKSSSSQEYNSMSGMVNDNKNNQFSGHVGTYYNLNSIPEDSWKFIKNYINERIAI